MALSRLLFPPQQSAVKMMSINKNDRTLQHQPFQSWFSRLYQLQQRPPYPYVLSVQDPSDSNCIVNLVTLISLSALSVLRLSDFIQLISLARTQQPAHRLRWVEMSDCLSCSVAACDERYCFYCVRF